MSKKKKPLEKVQNDLSGVLFSGEGLLEYARGGSQLSQVDTLYKNVRAYLLSNQRNLLTFLYTEIGLVETIVDIPVEDALRGGFTLTSGQLSEEELQELIDDCEYDVEQLKQGEKWKRLFGGGGLIILTDQPADTPLDIKAITEDTPLEFKPVDLWELYNSRVNEDREFYEVEIVPEKDRLDEDLSAFNYYGKKVHRSRVIIMKGKMPPSFIRPRLRGWGLSELETVVRSINQYLKSTDLTFEVLDEFKLDIFKIKGLIAALASPKGEDIIRRRLAIANKQKNYQNAIAMDSEDSHESKQLSFTGLAEVMKGIREQIASDLRMPMTKLFGISSAGFNSGEDDIENYNAMIESRIRPDLKRSLKKIIKLRCKQKYGFVPDDLKIELKSLRTMTSEQEENVKTQKFNRVQQARSAGDLTSQEYREAINKDGLLPIKLDPDVDTDSLKIDEDEKEFGEIPDDKQSKLKPKKAKEPKA